MKIYPNQYEMDRVYREIGKPSITYLTSFVQYEIIEKIYHLQSDLSRRTLDFYNSINRQNSLRLTFSLDVENQIIDL